VYYFDGATVAAWPEPTVRRTSCDVGRDRPEYRGDLQSVRLRIAAAAGMTSTSKIQKYALREHESKGARSGSTKPRASKALRKRGRNLEHLARQVSVELGAVGIQAATTLEDVY
jgi:hypothetical protein